MINDNTCKDFLDELSGNRPFSAELKNHLELCHNCREMSNTLKKIRVRDSAFPPSILAEIKKRVFTKTLPENINFSAEPISVAGSAKNVVNSGVGWVGFAFTGGVLAIVILIGALLFDSYRLPKNDNLFPSNENAPLVLASSSPMVPSNSTNSSIASNAANPTNAIIHLHSSDQEDGK
ncbi:MAG: hypothetical protein HQM10_03145 [Candidatus Riflebacteria bacterium]|nr:hypothetical protein [Candidatus Riflebacteria bacterium]